NDRRGRETAAKILHLPRNDEQHRKKCERSGGSGEQEAKEMRAIEGHDGNALCRDQEREIVLRVQGQRDAAGIRGGGPKRRWARECFVPDEKQYRGEKNDERVGAHLDCSP